MIQDLLKETLQKKNNNNNNNKKMRKTVQIPSH